MSRILLIIIITFLSFFQLQGSDLYFYHLGLRDGLSQINIMSIYQDEFGVMWFGTTEGLNRYNGKNIETFRPSNDGEGLTQNVIYSIQGNQAGAMYIRANSDLVRYDLYSQKFKILQQGGINAICYKDSSLWVSVEKEIKLYDEVAEEFRLVTTLNKNIADVIKINVSDEGCIWLGTKDGLVRLSIRNPQEQKYILKGYAVNSIYEDRNHNIWVGTNSGGLFMINMDGEITNYTHEIGSNSISNNQVRTILEDKHGNIWVGTFFGLNKYDPNTRQWESYVNSDNISYSLSHSSVFSLFQDKQGTIWIGTYFGGVNYFNAEADPFTYYGASSTDSKYLSFPFVGKMVEDDNRNLWICTEGGGLNSMNLDTRQFSRYKLRSNSKESAEFNNLKSIWYRKDKDLLYIGIHGGGLAVFDIKSKKTKYILSDNAKKYSLPNNTINKMQYYKGMLVLLTQSGLVKMDIDRELFYPLNDTPFVSGVLSGIDLHTFFIDSKDRLWVQKTVGELLCIDLISNAIKSYRYDQSKSNTIGRFNINDIFESNNGQLFFATAGSGIFTYNEDTDNFNNYTAEKDHLISNYCYSISESSSGKLILLFNKGFSFFDPKNPITVQFKSSLDFPLIGFNIGSSVYTTKDKETFIGGVNGLVSFSETDLKLSNNNHSLYFDKLYVNNKLISPNDESGVLDKCLPLMKEIVIQPDQNNIAIEFASSNYLQSEVRSYEYQLEGFDKDWISTDESKVITYTNLNPGHYKLKVREVSTSIDDARLVCELLVNVRPPFYLTKLAYFIYFVLLICLIVAIAKFYSWRTKIQTTIEFERKEKERIEELNNIKFRFFTNISHEFRTPLTLIIGQVDLLLNYSELKSDICKKITRVRQNAIHLQNLITELLDFRKQEQGFTRLEVVKIDLVDYMQEIYQSFRDYAEKRHIRFSFDFDGSPIYVYIDPVQFQKAIYNLLSNAFKYTSEQGEIKINITSDSQNVYLRILDDGIGIPAESLQKIFERFYQIEYRSSGLTLGTGIGLALTKEIIMAHKGTIDVESKVNEGSCFSIILKQGSSHFSKEELETKDLSRAKYAIKQDTLDEVVAKDSLSENTIDLELDLNDRPTVLLVEDNEELIELLAESFSKDYKVYKAMDGEEGWEVLLNIQPDIVVSDIMMPRLTGKELCYRIKNNVNTSHIPVILLTAQTSDSEILDGLMFGADAYVTKPFNMQVLIQNCSNLLRTKRKLYSKTVSLEKEGKIYEGANEQDKILIEKAVGIIKKNFSNNLFDMNQLGLELGMGRSKLYTKMKDITGFTPNEFTLNIKLEEATNLLDNRPEMNISEIAFHLGFSSAKYFTKCFKTFYGTTPQDWRRKKNEDV